MKAETVQISVVEKKNPSWTDYVAAGIEFVSRRETSSWQLGDLANEVCQIKRGGDCKRDDTISKYAIDIGINKKSLQEYARVCRMFPSNLRHAMLTFRHHQLVCKLDNTTEWLEKAHDNNWSCDQLAREISLANKKEKGQEDDSIEFDRTVSIAVNPKQPDGTIYIYFSERDFAEAKNFKFSAKTNLRQIMNILKKTEEPKENGNGHKD